MNDLEGRIANAEAYASHYCDARDFSESALAVMTPEAIRNVVWSAVRSGFMEGERHEAASCRQHFKVYGTDDCSECEPGRSNGRITLYYTSLLCVECQHKAEQSVKESK